jgi:pimeloyl-ACP methyl ester carboxylesterase
MTANASHPLETPHPPERSPCPAPANFRAEVARYEREARIDVWDGPRYRMTYRTLGQGPTLVLAPGIAATYRVYALLLNRLSERFRTVIYDYPGEHGDDRARLGRTTHDDLAADFLGLADHLGAGPVHPVGLSFGSTIVLRALEREPGRFPRAVVQGAFARREVTLAERVALAIGRRLPGNASALPLRGRLLDYNIRCHFPREIGDRWHYYVEQHGLTPIRALALRLSLMRGLDLRPRLGRITAETLVLQGNEDRVISRALHDELTAGLPAGRSVVMPNVGHQPHLTHAEALAGVIAEWLLPCEPAGCVFEGRAGGCSGMPGGCGGAGDGSCQEALKHGSESKAGG